MLAYALLYLYVVVIGFILAFANGWPRRQDIKDRVGFLLYLTRWYLLEWRRAWALLLHKMHRPDDDTCHHDHPWWFFTLVLWGGYVEEVTQPDGSVKVLHNTPGTILFRRATHTHRIAALPKGTCWTLVLRGRKVRPWGFLTPNGLVYWKTFLDTRNSIPWCEGWLRPRAA